MDAAYWLNETIVAERERSEFGLQFVNQENARDDMHRALAQDVLKMLLDSGVISFTEHVVGKHRVYRAELDMRNP